MPVKDEDFVTRLAREALRRAELDDLQSLFVDELRVSSSPMGYSTDISPVLISVSPKRSWIEYWNTSQLKSLLVEGRQVNGAIPY